MNATLTAPVLPWSARRSAAAPGALIVGGDYQGLGIARALGRRGVPVVVVDNERSIARFSRYVGRAVRVPDLRDPRATVNALLDTGRRLGLGGWVLFPTRDETVAAIAAHRDELATLFRVPSPGWPSIRWAWDKRNTYELAERLAIPTPRTWRPVDDGDLSRIPPEAFPVAVKPAIKEHFIYATHAKAWRAATPAELTRAFARARAIAGDGEVPVQELIPGDGRTQFAYCALFKEGQALASMIARRRRQHPHEFGRASTYVETLDVPAIEALAQRFLRAIDYYGLVEVEFKRDPRDGRFKLLDVNARTWGYHTLGARAGVDFSWLLYADQTGALPALSPVSVLHARAGVRWVRMATDVPAAALDIAAGRLRLSDYLRSLAGVHTESVLCRDDPLPALAELALVPYLAVTRGF